MTRRAWVLALVVTAGSMLAMPAAAHDEFRFVGTVVRLELAKNRFAMRFREEDKTEVTVEIAFTPKTEVTRDKKPAPRADLKPGTSVVVDALGDDYDNLEAVAIRIVPKL